MKIMSNVENLSGFEFDDYRQKSILTLILNLRSANEFARALQASRDSVLTRYEYEHKTHQWFELTVAPNRYIPIATQRTVLGPESEAAKRHGIDRLVVYTPAKTDTLSVPYPHDMFVEIVDDNDGASLHILNGSGLWQYQDRDDLAPSPRFEATNDLYDIVHGQDVTAKIPMLNHLLVDYVPRLQSSDDVGHQ
jgi:hypothetical protein